MVVIIIKENTLSPKGLYRPLPNSKKRITQVKFECLSKER